MHAPQINKPRRIYMFADESGQFDFSRRTGATRYFVLVTITAHSCTVGNNLLDLRRDMAWKGQGLNDEFHASENPQHIRDQVFAAMQAPEFEIDATVIEKCKVHPAYRSTNPRFYHYAWYEHMRRIAPRIVMRGDSLLVASSSIAARKIRMEFWRAVTDAVTWLVPGVHRQIAFWPTPTDPCLQAADYCSWAIQRKWEKGDPRSYELIQHKIKSEELLYSSSAPEYY